jgi:Domain of unknown function (DUF389)
VESPPPSDTGRPAIPIQQNQDSPPASNGINRPHRAACKIEVSGVFISVTTVPAAGNIALGIAFGVGDAIWGSTLQLLVNLSGMAVAGWAALAIQQAVWSKVSVRRAKAMTRPKRML